MTEKTNNTMDKQFDLNKQKLLTIWGKINGKEFEENAGNLSKWLKDIKSNYFDKIDNIELKEYFCKYMKKDSESLIHEITQEKFGLGNVNFFNSHAHVYWRTKKDEKDKIEYLCKGKKNVIDKDEAEREFKEIANKSLKPFLEKENESEKALSELDKLEKNGKKFSGTQLRRKMAVVNRYANETYDCIAIYKDDAIDYLYKHLCVDNPSNNGPIDNPPDNGSVDNPCEQSELGFFVKNNEIFKKAKDFVNLQDLSLANTLKLTAALWRFYQYSEDDFPTEKSPNVIFYGAPGTGKTYAVTEYFRLNNIVDVDETDEKLKQKAKGFYKKVQFHPSFTYEDFIEGVKPTGMTESSVKLQLVNGVFKEFCIKALAGIKDKPEEDIPYYFVVDEINRANLSTVFGETLSLLEPSYRDKAIDKNGNAIPFAIDTQYSALERGLDENSKKAICYSQSNGKFGIPRNVRFIGMMNDVDKSIDSFDIALRRRFRWIQKNCDYDVIYNETISLDKSTEFVNSCKSLNGFISGIKPESNVSIPKENLNLGKAYEFGHSLFLKVKDICVDNRKKSIDSKIKAMLFNEYLRPTLKEYLRSEVNGEKELEEKLKKALDIFTSDCNEENNDEEG